MSLVLSTSTITLWHDIVERAEQQRAIKLSQELEMYLISLLIRHTNKPDIARQIMAIAYLNALQKHRNARDMSLQEVGDQCLLLTGLFPKFAEKRLVKVSYFVGCGRAAYATISYKTTDIFNALASEFVILMDVLQSIRENDVLLPHEAYALWHDVGSFRAYQFLQNK